MMDNLAADLNEWIGRREDSEGEVTAELVARFRATLANMPLPPFVVPLGIHWCLALDSVPQDALGRDGHPAKGRFLPPVSLPNRMWAAGELFFRDQLQIGDHVHRRSTIRDIRSKQGRSGTLCFVTVDHQISTPRGVAIEERQDIVYRDAGVQGATKLGTQADGATDHVEVMPDPILLFRYSALTFNSHRIHYDRDYAVESEGYPERVVHGPLQATLLMNLVAAHRGAPESFSFRAVRPAFANNPLFLAAMDGTMFGSVRSVDRNRMTCMEAEARWAN